jgi:nitrous oxidase accessory protein NosD
VDVSSFELDWIEHEKEGVLRVKSPRATITNNHGGIGLHYCSNNTIYGNTITGCGNWGGVGIYESYDNTFYRNNFTNNYRRVLTDTNSTNNWDEGYPVGGNY